MKPDFAFLDEAGEHLRALCAAAADLDEASFYIDLGKAADAGDLVEWERLWHKRAGHLRARDLIELVSS